MTPDDLEGCCLGALIFFVVFFICMGIDIYFMIQNGAAS